MWGQVVAFIHAQRPSKEQGASPPVGVSTEEGALGSPLLPAGPQGVDLEVSWEGTAWSLLIKTNQTTRTNISFFVPRKGIRGVRSVGRAGEGTDSQYHPAGHLAEWVKQMSPGAFC